MTDDIGYASPGSNARHEIINRLSGRAIRPVSGCVASRAVQNPLSAPPEAWLVASMVQQFPTSTSNPKVTAEVAGNMAIVLPVIFFEMEHLSYVCIAVIPIVTLLSSIRGRRGR